MNNDEFEIKLVVAESDNFDSEERDRLARSLKRELDELGAQTKLAKEDAPAGTKSGEAIIVGQLITQFAPLLLPPTVEVLKAWLTRQQNVPLEMEMKRGKNSVKIKYDPKKMKQADLEKLLANAMETMRK